MRQFFLLSLGLSLLLPEFSWTPPAPTRSTTVSSAFMGRIGGRTEERKGENKKVSLLVKEKASLDPSPHFQRPLRLRRRAHAALDDDARVHQSHDDQYRELR